MNSNSIFTLEVKRCKLHLYSSYFGLVMYNQQEKKILNKPPKRKGKASKFVVEIPVSPTIGIIEAKGSKEATQGKRQSQ